MEAGFPYWDLLLQILHEMNMVPNFHSAEGVFCLLVWVSTLLMLALLFLSMLGGMFDADDASGGGDMDGDAGSFSVRTVLGFALGFSWGGFLAVQSGCNIGGALAIAAAVGVCVFYMIAAMMRFIYSLRSDGTLNYESLKGMKGTVYVTLPPHGESGGQVQVSHPSQMVTMPAIQYGKEPLPPQTRIEVVEATTALLVVRAVQGSSHSDAP